MTHLTLMTRVFGTFFMRARVSELLNLSVISVIASFPRFQTPELIRHECHCRDLSHFLRTRLRARVFCAY